MTLHSRFPFDRLPNGWTDDADALYIRDWGQPMPMVAISEHARTEVPYPLNFAGVVHHGLQMDVFKPTGRRRRDFLSG